MPRIAIDAGADHPTRNRRYQAPDPAWADRELLERIRQRLWKMDPRLNLWWNPHWKNLDREHPGRWAVMYWLERSRCWSVVFYHEAPDGSYRHVDNDCVDVLIRRLRACEQDAKQAQAAIDAEVALRRQREKLRLEADLNDVFKDVRDRAYGVKQTFGRGSGPRRARKMRDDALSGRVGDSVREAHEKAREAEHERIKKERIEREFGHQ